jgi:hypothetical protein
MTNDSMGKIINANINLSENICLRLKLEHQKHLLDNSQTIGAPKTLIRQFTN